MNNITKYMLIPASALCCGLMGVSTSYAASCPSTMYGWATADGGTTGGGNAAPQVVTTVKELRNLAKGDTPRVLQLSGTFVTGERPIMIGSNKTLIGVDANATIQGGIRIKSDDNIIIRNLNIIGNGKGKKPADTMNVGYATHLWFDHLNLVDASDGLLDMTHAVNYTTVSWTKLSYTDPTNNHKFPMLLGLGARNEKEEKGKNKHTIHHNWFGNLAYERMPRLQWGQGHIYNNYYNAPGNAYTIGAGSHASLLVENNYFKNVNDPHKIVSHSTGRINARGNIYDNTTGTKTNGTKGNNPPAKWSPSYLYHLDNAKNIPDLVERCAGPH